MTAALVVVALVVLLVLNGFLLLRLLNQSRPEIGRVVSESAAIGSSRAFLGPYGTVSRACGNADVASVLR